MLEDPGVANLTSASSQPLGNFDFNEQQNSSDEDLNLDEMNPSTLALLVGIFLFLILLPALIMFLGLLKQGKEFPNLEQDKSEYIIWVSLKNSRYYACMRLRVAGVQNGKTSKTTYSL